MISYNLGRKKFNNIGHRFSRHKHKQHLYEIKSYKRFIVHINRDKYFFLVSDSLLGYTKDTSPLSLIKDTQKALMFINHT
jgi:hypothetical protein